VAAGVSGIAGGAAGGDIEAVGQQLAGVGAGMLQGMAACGGNTLDRGGWVVVH
jgi:hypothetical protein